MALEKTWRWFGPNDTITLADLRQMGVEGVVTSLHHIPTGEVWPEEEIRFIRDEIERHGMRWSVVESLNVSEQIKRNGPQSAEHIAHYIRSLRNLGNCGIDTVCYNFMPVLDWARTDLHFHTDSGGESMLFDYPTFAAFDIYLLERPNAEKDYPEDVRCKAAVLNDQWTKEEKDELARNIIIVTQSFIRDKIELPLEEYKQIFRGYLAQYHHISKEQLRAHLASFLQQIIPVAEEAGVRMCIHPDDPPFPLLGLPRICSTQEDMQWIMDQYPSPSNGLTFCSGSLSGSIRNDVVEIARALAPHIQFVHLRNTAYLANDTFYESGHLTGQVDMFALVKILIEEQKHRRKSGRKDYRLPFRPDHGIRILDDFKRTANPGYPLIGRLKGLAEIDGLQTGIERMWEDKQ